MPDDTGRSWMVRYATADGPGADLYESQYLADDRYDAIGQVAKILGRYAYVEWIEIERTTVSETPEREAGPEEASEP